MTDYNTASGHKFAAPRARSITRVYVGQLIHIFSECYEVTDVYPGFVRVKPAKFNPEIPHPQPTTFNLGDLVMAGYEPDILYNGYGR